MTDISGSSPDAVSVIGRALLAMQRSQIPDVLADPEYATRICEMPRGYRTILGVPLLRESERDRSHRSSAATTVEPFTDKQIELVQTFADQAVIAIENVRLFEEVQAKTRDLTRR